MVRLATPPLRLSIIINNRRPSLRELSLSPSLRIPQIYLPYAHIRPGRPVRDIYILK